MLGRFGSNGGANIANLGAVVVAFLDTDVCANFDANVRDANIRADLSSNVRTNFDPNLRADVGANN